MPITVVTSKNADKDMHLDAISDFLSDATNDVTIAGDLLVTGTFNVTGSHTIDAAHVNESPARSFLSNTTQTIAGAKTFSSTANLTAAVPLHLNGVPVELETSGNTVSTDYVLPAHQRSFVHNSAIAHTVTLPARSTVSDGHTVIINCTSANGSLTLVSGNNDAPFYDTQTQVTTTGAPAQLNLGSGISARVTYSGTSLYGWLVTRGATTTNTTFTDCTLAGTTTVGAADTLEVAGALSLAGTTLTATATHLNRWSTGQFRVDNIPIFMIDGNNNVMWGNFDLSPGLESGGTCNLTGVQTAGMQVARPGFGTVPAAPLGYYQFVNDQSQLITLDVTIGDEDARVIVEDDTLPMIALRNGKAAVANDDVLGSVHFAAHTATDEPVHVELIDLAPVPGQYSWRQCGEIRCVATNAFNAVPASEHEAGAAFHFCLQDATTADTINTPLMVIDQAGVDVTALRIDGVAVTSSAAELNLLDNATANSLVTSGTQTWDGDKIFNGKLALGGPNDSDTIAGLCLSGNNDDENRSILFAFTPNNPNDEVNGGELLGRISAVGLDGLVWRTGARIDFQSGAWSDTGTRDFKAPTKIIFYTEDSNEPSAIAAGPRMTVEHVVACHVPLVTEQGTVRTVKTTSATAYTVLSTDDVVVLDAALANITVTLPDPSTLSDGKVVTIKRITTSSQTVTLSCVAAINGVVANYNFNAIGIMCATLVASQTHGWHFLSKYTDAAVV